MTCDLVRFYNTVGHDLTAANIHWTHVAKNFKIQWKALKDHKDDDDPEVPKVTKALHLIKRTEGFQDFLHHTIGFHIIPLAYIIQANVNVPLIPPPLVTNQPHSEENGSVENEMIACATHGHALFHEDNSQVYCHLEEVMRGTSYAASIKPFQ